MIKEFYKWISTIVYPFFSCSRIGILLLFATKICQLIEQAIENYFSNVNPIYILLTSTNIYCFSPPISKRNSSFWINVLRIELIFLALFLSFSKTYLREFEVSVRLYTSFSCPAWNNQNDSSRIWSFWRATFDSLFFSCFTSSVPKI